MLYTFLIYRNHLRNFTLKKKIEYSKQHFMFVTYNIYISIFFKDKISTRASYKNTCLSLQYKDIQGTILNKYYSVSVHYFIFQSPF